MVKTHLTSAVNEEIVTLKNQIKQLKETCTRLEQENNILKQYATPDTLKLIETQRIQTNSSLTSLPQVIQANLNAPSATSLNPVTFELGYPNPESTSSSEMMNPVAQLVTTDHMTASFTEQPGLSNNPGYINLTPDQVNSAVDNKEVNN